MKIAVSGASGFIGTVICKKLLEQNHTVIALARDPLKVQYSTEIRYFSLEEANQVDLNDVDAVIHTASYFPKSHEDSAEEHSCMLYNMAGTKSILDAAKRDKVKSFIHFSSGNVYQCVDGLKKVSEDFVIDPSFRITAYLKSKIVAEDYVIKYNREDFRTVILRPSYVYGAGMIKGFLPKIAQKIKDGILISKDLGNYYIDLVEVNDVASATIAVATNVNCKGVYNIGGDNPELTQHVANLLCFISNRKDLMIGVNLCPPGKSHPALDITKAKNDFQYNPRNLGDGLQQYRMSL